jgi:hypothetical protein
MQWGDPEVDRIVLSYGAFGSGQRTTETDRTPAVTVLSPL